MSSGMDASNLAGKSSSRSLRHKVQPTQRYAAHRFHRDLLPVDGHVVSDGVDAHRRRGVVVEHVLLADGARLPHRL